MPNWRKRHSTEHFEAADIPEGRDVTIKIVSIGNTTVEGDKGKQSMPLWTFEVHPEYGKTMLKRTFLPSKTVGHCMAAMFGVNDDAWIGKRVTLYEGDAGGGNVGVRCKGSPDFQGTKTIRLRGAPGQGKITVELRNTATARAKPATQTDPATGEEVPA